ncbi:MAG: RNA-protein complex protein Nop10 [Nanoarchaeota archaeon]|nr:RNA-protein complex protein Nop10 [Nanoarchaeota archaeon]MBU1644065.1 RNA-protein complex protein Nop10 [Nanoarchaeota archaeon]MBU1977307.1 RNA-protein complex protein Nop10 [Nanoarchaeota archaeon]
MAKHIHKCYSCNEYTLEVKCPKCNQPAILPKPPKFSLNDKYSSYRREIKKKELEEKGII